MQSTSYTPMAGQAMPWYDVWLEVISHPSRDSFRRILADPTWSPVRAYIWVAILGLIFGIIQAVLTQALGSSLGGAGRVIGAGVSLICVAIAAPIFSVLGLAISAGINHFVARMFQGTGTYDKMAYCIGAFQAPVSIFSYLVSFISLLASGGNLGSTGMGFGSILSLCILPISLAVGIYAFVLEVLAIDAVENIGTGKAVITALAPLIVGILLAACLVGAAMALGAAAYFNR